MSACWALSVDWQALSDGVSGAAAVVVAGCAWKGLEAWRHELRSKRRQELAEEALALSYRISDAIDHMRGPFAWTSELDKVERRENESEDSYQSRRHLGVVEVRYSEHSSAFADFLAVRYRVAAIFGVDVKQAMEQLIVISNRVRQAPSSVFRFKQAQDRALRQLERAIEARNTGIEGGEDYKSPEFIQKEVDKWAANIEKFEAILFMGIEDDDVSKEQKKVLTELEEKLQGSAQLGKTKQ